MLGQLHAHEESLINYGNEYIKINSMRRKHYPKYWLRLPNPEKKGVQKEKTLNEAMQATHHKITVDTTVETPRCFTLAEIELTVQ